MLRKDRKAAAASLTTLNATKASEAAGEWLPSSERGVVHKHCEQALSPRAWKESCNPIRARQESPGGTAISMREDAGNPEGGRAVLCLHEEAQP